MLSSFATITYIAGLIHNHMGNRVEILEGVFSVVIRSRLLVFAVAGLWLLTVILYLIEAAANEDNITKYFSTPFQVLNAQKGRKPNSASNARYALSLPPVINE